LETETRHPTVKMGKKSDRSGKGGEHCDQQSPVQETDLTRIWTTGGGGAAREKARSGIPVDQGTSSKQRKKTVVLGTPKKRRKKKKREDVKEVKEQ